MKLYQVVDLSLRKPDDPRLNHFWAVTLLGGKIEHTHQYSIQSDRNGKIIKGKTNITNDHFHIIKKIDITEPAGKDNHTHPLPIPGAGT